MGQEGENQNILSWVVPTHRPWGQAAKGTHQRRDPKTRSRSSPARAHPNATSPGLGIPHLHQLGARHGQQVGHAGEFGEELLGELLEAGTAQPLQEQAHAGPQLHPLRPVVAAERGA